MLAGTRERPSHRHDQHLCRHGTASTRASPALPRPPLCCPSRAVASPRRRLRPAPPTVPLRALERHGRR
jgi:hypothetical protein